VTSAPGRQHSLTSEASIAYRLTEEQQVPQMTRFHAVAQSALGRATTLDMRSERSGVAWRDGTLRLERPRR
jgi:hypothetical protein